MANFTASNLVAAQTTLAEQFIKPDMREKVLPTVALGVKNKNILVKGVEELRTREDRAVYGYMMKRQVRTPASQRSATHTGPSGDSIQQPFTWVTYADSFQISLKEMDNNIFTFNQAMAQNIKNCILNIHSQIESDNIAALLAAKNQIVKTTNPVPGKATWNGTNFVHEISQSLYGKQFTQIAKSVMMANYYNSGVFDAIFDLSTYTDANFWMSQGSGNAVNTAFQFTGMEIAPSVELSDSNYPNGVALVMEPGTFANIQWIPKQNREGYGDYNSYLGGYGSIVDPITNPGGIYSGGLVFAVHGYALRQDTSATNGVAQDNMMQFEISIDNAFAISPFSTANESVVYEFGYTA
jgi:hypothetical protein